MKTKKKEELFNNSNEIIIKELENALEGWQKDFHRVEKENQKLREELKGCKELSENRVKVLMKNVTIDRKFSQTFAKLERNIKELDLHIRFIKTEDTKQPIKRILVKCEKLLNEAQK